MTRFLVVNLNPTFQRTVQLARLKTGEVNRAEFNRSDIAGKGVNTTRVLHQLGAEVRHLTHLGPGRERLLELCGIEGLDIIWEPTESPIRTCITLLDRETRKTTEVVENTLAVEEDVVDRIRRRYETELPTFDWVILTGSRSPGYPEDFFVELTRIAKDRGQKVVADFRGPELIDCLGNGLDLVKINLVEFAQTFLPGLKVSESEDSDAVNTVCKSMAELSLAGCDYVISRGGREALFAREGKIGRVIPPDVEVKNTIGSGDSFTAGLCYSLSRGLPLKEAVEEGARCGSINAGNMKPGSIIELQTTE